VYAALGEIDPAISALERAAAAREPELVRLGGRPVYAPLRASPRFETLRARVGV
jgi:hypothetical protein